MGRIRQRVLSTALAAACLVLAPGCSGAGTGFDGTWTLSSIDSKPVSAGAADQLPYFTLSGQQVGGFDGCNEFSGGIDEPGGITATRRGCPPEAIMLPLDLHDLKSHLQTGSISGDVLSFPSYKRFPESKFQRLIQ